MLNKSIFTEKENAFLILYPEDVDITDDLLDKLIPTENKQWMRTTKDPWLHYQPHIDEDLYSWELPGIKLIISGDLAYDKVKALADELVTKLKDHCGRDIQLVTIDKNGLTRIQ
jgi:hypothetical protein